MRIEHETGTGTYIDISLRSASHLTPGRPSVRVPSGVARIEPLVHLSHRLTPGPLGACVVPALAILAALLLPLSALGQQFNSDNYLAMPHGTLTAVVTAGSGWNTFATSVALFENWEFFASAALVWEDEEQGVSSHFTTNVYAKYMFHENEARNAGFAVSGGIGSFPGYLDQERVNRAFEQLWMIPQLTIPLFSGRLLWDLNPGVAVNFDPADQEDSVWGFTYSTRVALYGIVPASSIVGEVFGSTGDLAAPAQYKAGLRWEPSESFVAAATVGGAFDGERSAGFELGFMLFSPRFACFGGCEPDS